MRNPDIEGYAKAWIINWEETDSAQQACLKCYLIEGNFHPIWNQWCLSVVHLRDITGVPPATKIKPEYTHEFIIVAANPKVELDPDIRPEPGWHMTPIDVCEQFKSPSDKDAIKLLNVAASFICGGKISPDQDFRMAWSKLIQSLC